MSAIDIELVKRAGGIPCGPAGETVPAVVDGRPSGIGATRSDVTGGAMDQERIFGGSEALTGETEPEDRIWSLTEERMVRTMRMLTTLALAAALAIAVLVGLMFVVPWSMKDTIVQSRYVGAPTGRNRVFLEEKAADGKGLTGNHDGQGGDRVTGSGENDVQSGSRGF